MRSIWIGLVVLMAVSLGAMQLEQDTLIILPNDPVTNPTSSPSLEAIGDSADIGMKIRSKGTSGNIFAETQSSFDIRTYDGDTPYSGFLVNFNAAPNPRNYIAVRGAASGAEPAFYMQGLDADVSLDIDVLGTGRLTVDAINVLTTTSTDTGITNKTFVGPVIAAQTASAGSAMKLTSSATLMTTAEEGAFELDTKVLNFTPEDTYRGVLPTKYSLCLSGTNTLTSSTSEQALFDSVGTGTLTLPTGTFYFSTQVALSSMSATLGNLAFDILGAGTATLGTVQYNCQGIDGAAATMNTAFTLTGSTMNQAQTPASLVSAGISTECQFQCSGTFRVTATGTIIPSATLVTAAAAVVAIGSNFTCHSIGRSNFTNIGPWS